MRQHMLNGWLVAALLALTCLLGITAYAEVKKELPRTAWVHGFGADQSQGAMCAVCSLAPRGSTTSKA
ncbi:hypothetical protein EOA75_25945 [Mesorhizobium sp. M1A.F.Ca.IN.022.07.1.1]|nr:hypothetical protein EJ078_21860 [Mesorhizobium sp. M1A.F.Ca.IN.022.06.1.1]RUV58805.1 hypothetical protein EOA64_22625 [Mesorhizobium sp. M1A.F.Ca.IN.022.02.1.1]RUV78841.1 hypothetical protein EOA50_04925 [Mesorhizobium sp. M1A.F.Ca.IN.020.30.1.1]RUV86946.1 hypothetical protein EOA75_25945 [Mesorhizobium sp. M1A.F.Ca.IN.022.07.1.1]RWG02453.1 MAG: hypothetical protein EOQ54_19865 [Mesorhizobium sp.]TGQ13432.1 hypothetical protein EN860_031145 [Mesorhizobium sp. M00.F.Ca.ET.217.01.1.1]TGV928